MLPVSSNAIIVSLFLVVSADLLPKTVLAGSVVCNTADYCPDGWSVKRKASYDPTTCDPMAGIKCEKPYQCVHSHCGMSFCCIDPRRLKQWMDLKERELEVGDDEL